MAKRGLEVIDPKHLRDGIYAKRVTAVGIVRNVVVRTVSECRRYAVISYGPGRHCGKKTTVPVTELQWYTGKPIQSITPIGPK
jgi:hypothetical protein